jgi:predicted RNA methylase
LDFAILSQSPSATVSFDISGYKRSRIHITLFGQTSPAIVTMPGAKKLSIKQLESYLQDLDDFQSPKVELEQYATPPHIAALLLNAIDQTYDDVEGKVICDLGCGTGRLSAGSIICGSKMTYGFDVDQSALDDALQNFNGTFNEDEDDEISSVYRSCPNINLVRADIASEDYDPFWKQWHNFFDTVIMNPPFGTKHNAGLDIKFLERAIGLSKGAVYSLHKTSTRDVSIDHLQTCPTRGHEGLFLNITISSV